MPIPVFPPPPADPKEMPAWGRRLVALLNQTLGELDSRTSVDSVLRTRRLGASSGTALAAGNVAIGAGWGATATFTVAGNDQRGSVTVTAGGAGLAVNATVTVTYVDGAWRVVPFVTAVRGDANAPTGSVSASSTTTVLTLTNHTLPVAGTAYTLSWNCIG